MVQSALEVAMGLGMFLLMFGMGLTLQTDDFRRIARSPRPAILGTVLQLLVMPIVGITIANAFGMSALGATGIVVIAACPGGMFSNMFIYVARGNTALSITLTAIATLVTLFTLPLWVEFALGVFSGAGAETVEMPILDTATQLGTLTVLPVLLGMLTRARWPRSVSWERRLTVPAIALIGLGFAAQNQDRTDLPIEAFVDALLPTATFALAAVVVGISVPRLFGIAVRDTVTIALELIVKNTLLGLVLVGQALDLEAALPIFAFMIFQTPVGILLLVGWRWLVRRGVVASDLEPDTAPAPAPGEPHE